ncbi:MAG: hypothetical protein EXS08_11695 [Planctomycetes bacterium]|nr:hypothetical protein [Planctomycetota bacterium]
MNSDRRARFALAAVWLIAAWVLAGAVFKLGWGTPALLPAGVRAFGERLGLGLGLTYKFAIGIELAIVAAALTKPRWGWLLQVALLVVFDVVLTQQIAAGVANCGCFGAKFSMDPRVMLGIDSTLLVALLAARPWSCLGPGLPYFVPLALGAIGIAVPWFYDRELPQGEIVGNGKTIENPYALLDIGKWIGQDIWDTPLGKPPLSQYVDVKALPLDGLWVFWRATCDHCAVHLKHLAETEHDERDITLVQLEEPNDSLANQVVHAMPDGLRVQRARLPASISYVLQTPGELLLEAGKVVAAQEAANPENGLKSPR